MFTKILVTTIATVFVGTTVTMAQGVIAVDPSQDTAIDANTFNQFESFVKSKAPENLDEVGIRTFADGVTDYIYGYSLLAIAMTERVATTVSGLTPPSAPTRAPINQLVIGTGLPNAAYHDVVLPSTTTLYASSFMDLTRGPLILHVPPLPAVVGTNQPRFFIVELLDAWTNVSRQSPSTRQHSQPGDYLLVGPSGTTTSTAGYAGVIQFDSNTVWSILRFFTDGSEADLEALNDALQNPANPADGLTLRPLGTGADYKPPSDLPVNPSIDTFTQPIKQVDNMDACAFFGTLSTMMMTNPPRKIDALIEPSLKNLGLLTAKKPFSCVSLPDQNEVIILNAAVVAAKDLLASINPPSASAKTNYWSLPLNVGDYGINYILRALVAEKALGANRPEDAVYGYGAYDSNGIDPTNKDANRLDGANRYVVHFSPETSLHRTGEIPPVHQGKDGSPSGFWSVTLYDGNGFLVNNPNASYNAIGIPFVQNHKACLNADGSLDLYIQSDPPSDPKQFCNWLAAPSPDPDDPTASKFILFLRAYWPERAVLNGTWNPPPIVKQ
jgi:DNA sulfur modification protein DndE